MTPIISLIIPIYNAQNYLQPCLDSVAAQTVFADVQVLLVDDGSTDASPQICDDFAALHENVTVLHRENAGVSAARNAGLNAAEGEYIAFADADDLLEPQMLEKLYAAAQETGAQMTICAFSTDPPEGAAEVYYPFPENESFPRETLVSFMLENETCNALWNKLFVRSLITEGHIGMTVGKRLGEDREFILRYLPVCTHICYVPFAGYFYRYVETGAVRRPQSGYAAVLTEQFASDAERFAALGIPEEAYKEKCATCFCGRVCATIDLICRAFSGAKRLKELRTFYADETLQRIISALLPIAAPHTNAYSLRLLRCMQKKHILETRFWMHALSLRMLLYRLGRRQSET